MYGGIVKNRLENDEKFREVFDTGLAQVLENY